MVTEKSALSVGSVGLLQAIADRGIADFGILLAWGESLGQQRLQDIYLKEVEWFYHYQASASVTQVPREIFTAEIKPAIDRLQAAFEKAERTAVVRGTVPCGVEYDLQSGKILKISVHIDRTVFVRGGFFSTWDNGILLADHAAVEEFVDAVDWPSSAVVTQLPAAPGAKSETQEDE